MADENQLPDLDSNPSSQRLIDLQELYNNTNIADAIDEEILDQIGQTLKRLVEEDEQSMSEWTSKYEDYIKLALQIKEEKTFPWPNCANIKYPLLTIAALQFHARAYPSLIDNKYLVKGKVIGYDKTGEKQDRAERIGKHMTYQLIEQIPEWVEETDKLLLVLPIAGCAFRKVFWSSKDKRIKSELVLPTEIIVNYWASSLETARRITHKLYLYKNDVIERQRLGIYRDIELEDEGLHTRTYTQDLTQARKPVVSDSKDIPLVFYEIQTRLDLDDDGYEEPYIVTIHSKSGKVLRIVPNFRLDQVERNAKGEIAYIPAQQNYIKYDFIPAPDGGFLGVGFGVLLGSLNEVANSSINQLLDQGTMATTGGGFIGKGIRLKGGTLRFAPNEWKVVQSTGDDLAKNIFPLPVREPSPVLFNLFQAIVASGKEIIAISEISTGKLPGQNTPATTTLASVEEGLKLFTAIYKRIYRALSKEFKRIFELNSVYLQPVEYFTILDPKTNSTESGQVTLEDYKSSGIDVVPEADPNIASHALKLIKAQQVAELIQLGAVHPAKAAMRIMEALDIPNPEELLPEPQVNPEQQRLQAELLAKQQEQQFKQREHEMKMTMDAMKLKMKEMEMMLDLVRKTAEHRLALQTSEEKHRMQLRHQEEKVRQENSKPNKSV